MGEALVIDSSAALALLLSEPRSVQVRTVIEAAVGERLLVTDLFWLEVTNVLVRRHGWDADAVVEAVRELDRLPLETVTLDRPMLLAALDRSLRTGITMYDAAFLAVADAVDAQLLTLDDRLARAAGQRSAIRPATGTHEDPAPYDAGPPPPDWARHGRYLADLRRATGA